VQLPATSAATKQAILQSGWGAACRVFSARLQALNMRKHGTEKRTSVTTYMLRIIAEAREFTVVGQTE
jgi:hypothetical protein